jgi:small-conductance mechanosensitive channel
MFDELIAQVQTFLRQILTFDFLLQVGILAVALLVAAASRKFITNQVAKLEARLRSQGLVMEQFPWTADLAVAFRAAVFPLVVWLLGMLALGILRANEQPVTLIAWATPLFGLWALYKFASTLMEMNLSPERAKLWHRQLLRPIVFLLLFLGATGLLDNILNLQLATRADIRVTLQSMLLGLFVLIFFLFISRVVRQLLEKTILPRAGVDRAVNQVVTTFTGYGIVIAGILLAMSVMGINISALTVVAGGLAVGIGFGLQELINNFISGFILLTERSLAPGDVIEVDENVGTVQRIGLRTMLITTPDDVELIIPNGHLLGSTVKSYTHRSPEMRIHVGVTAVADYPPRDVLATLLEAARHAQVLETPAPRAIVTEFEGDTIAYDLEFWVNDPVQAPYVGSEVRLRIWELFVERGIAMSGPQDVMIVSREG